MDMQSKIKIKDSVIVFKARTARQLLKEGFHLIDIKPLKEDTHRSLFIFERTDEIMERLKEITITPLYAVYNPGYTKRSKGDGCTNSEK